MGSSVSSVLLIFALLAVVLLWMRRPGGGKRAGSLSVMDAVPLGGGRSLTVVRSGERYFLLGATAHAISLIAELAPQDVAAARPAPARTAGFSGLPDVAARIRSLRRAR
jgi:flagellar biosynthetic protein FliO